MKLTMPVPPPSIDQLHIEEAPIGNGGDVGTPSLPLARKRGFAPGARRLGLVMAVVALAVDQASKFWLLDAFDIVRRQPVRLGPWLNFILVWNPGISFSLLRAETLLGRLLLNGVTLVAIALLLLWLGKTRTRLGAVAIGLLVGGALGNVCDRLLYGAVVDFVSFHMGNFYWYVFNLADGAITMGVVLLLIEWIFQRPEATAAKTP